MFKQGLCKDDDSDTRQQYTFHYGSLVPLLVKSAVLLASGTACLRLNTDHRALLLVITLVLFHLVPINKRHSVSMTEGIGLEVSLDSGFFLHTRTHDLIPTLSIIDIVILEGFRGLQVEYYLACIVEGRDKLLLILPDTPLKLEQLKKIRHDIRRLLPPSI